MTPHLDNLRCRLLELELDAIVISQATNRRYLSGFTGSAGYLLISQKESVLATDFRYIEQAEAQAPDFRVVHIKGDIPAWFPGLLSEIRIRQIGFESDDLTLASYRQFVKAAKKLPSHARPRLVPTQGIVESLRAIKDENELRSIEAAAALADAAVEHANVILRKGATEREIAWSLEIFLRERGSESLPFEIVVASGPNSALAHASPTDRAIREGEPVVIDLGARVNGYCSDITRTIWLGEPAETLARVYHVVKQSQLAALDSVHTGASGEEIDSRAREVISGAGWAEAFGHALGHGVGLDVHEQPRLGPDSSGILTDGMVFTIEPGIYLKGWGGVRIEDMVSLEKDGPRVLTRASKL